jgi:thioredoxin reductase (NADPH)
MHDVAIVGSGPAGLTAGIFSARRNLKVIVFGDPNSLTQVEEAPQIEDWPGIESIPGVELEETFRSHAKKKGVELKEEKVVSVKKKGKFFSVRTEKGATESKTLIFATGAKHRKSIVKGEEEFAGKGVSYCASCDAPLYKGKKTFVLGGGDSAAMYALLLDQIGSDVTIIHRRDELRAAEAWQKKLFKKKLKIEWDTIAMEIKGDKMVKSIVLFNKKTKKQKEVPADGVFVALGTVPTSELAKGLGVKINGAGFIETDNYQKTNVDGVFAAGDCADTPSKKIVVAAGTGAVAAESAYNYIKDNE